MSLCANGSAGESPQNGTFSEKPVALQAELTHRCPLACPYCSNPLTLDPVKGELDTATWKRVLEEAAAAGAMQAHFSGGEPTIRRDLEALVAHADQIGLYANLITSAVTLDDERLARLQDAGLRHVQISFQDVIPAAADHIGHMPGAHTRKLAAARRVVAAGLGFTVNAVIQRHNIERVDDFIDLALELGAGRIEIANVQYYGWGLVNRAALIPTREQLLTMDQRLKARLPSLKGRIVVDYVVPDYYARRPKVCMGGWGRRFINVTPTGKVLPCHAAETIPGMQFETVFDRSLPEIWRDGAAFTAYRGTGWMKEPCRSCDQREQDWGGCRCQALALAGDAAAADPVCDKSAHHEAIAALAAQEAAAPPPPFRYRLWKESAYTGGV